MVLCHFVLRDRPIGAPDVASLADLVRPGVSLSLMDVSPDDRVLRSVVAEDQGLRFIGLFGNHIANDPIIDNADKHDPGFLADLIALMLKL